MQTASKSGSVSVDTEPTDTRPVRRLDTPNRPVAISRFVFNTFREAILHPTVTSYLDRRTGKIVGRDDKKVSRNGNVE